MVRFAGLLSNECVSLNKQKDPDNKMQDGIYSTNAEFPFNKLRLTQPTVLSGGNYFIKYLVDGEPLYIQPPKCKTRGGISKSGKRMHCDLMFSNDNIDFIRWVEELETHTCKTLYENRETWFETEMEMSDIENYFASPLKTYKSGKFYLARTNLATRLGKIALKIYDENEQDVDPDSIGETSQIMTILEVQGIKCSARSFQIEIELKQMMVLKPQDLFEKCILHSVSTPTNHLEKERAKEKEGEKEMDRGLDPPPVSSANTLDKTDVDADVDAGSKDNLVETNPEDPVDPEPTAEKESDPDPSSEDLTEVEFELDEIEDTVQIKKRNEVYYEIYREAKKKAKEAREQALLAYLDAKHIKQTYSLESTSDSDDEGEDETLDFSKETTDLKNSTDEEFHR